MKFGKQQFIYFGKRLAGVLLVIGLLLLLLAGIGWHFLQSDSEYVIQKIKERAKEKWNADVDIAGYHLDWADDFPMIQLEVKEVFLAVKGNEHPVLKVNKVISEFSAYSLLTRNFDAQPLQLDSVWIHLYKDSLNQSNMRFSKSDSQQNTSVYNKNRPFNFSLESLPHISINFLDFHHQNDFNKKWQRAVLQQASIQSEQNKEGEHVTRLLSDCHFEALVFKSNDPGFLNDTKGTLDLRFSLDKQKPTIILSDSYLKVGQNKYLLTGQLQNSHSRHLTLEIATEGVKIPDVLPLLSRKINVALSDVNIDQPIKAKFVLERSFTPGKKGTTKVNFASTDARIEFRDILMTSTDLDGYFSNDCDGDGIRNKNDNCIVIHQLDGDLFGLIPSKFSGEIDTLKNPQVNLKGALDIDLVRLNPMLAEKDKFTFLKGVAALDFEYSAALKHILKNPFDEQNISMKGKASFDNMRLDIRDQKEILPFLSGHLSFDNRETLLQDLSLNWKGSNILLSGRLNNLPEFLLFQNEPLKSDLKIQFDIFDLNQFLKIKTKEQQTKPRIKKRPYNKAKSNAAYANFEKAVKKVASNINGEIELEVGKLIYDTLYFTDLNTRFKIFSPRNAALLDSSMFKIEKLTTKFMGRSPIAIDIGLYSDSIRKVVLDIDIPSAVPIANILLPKGSNIYKGAADLRIKTASPLAAFFDPKSLLLSTNYSGSLILKTVSARTNALPKPIKKISGNFNFTNDRFLFDSLQFKYRGSPFVIDGQVDNYAIFDKEKKKKAAVALEVRGNYLNFKTKKKSNLRTTRQNTKTPRAPLTPAQLFRSLDTIFHYAHGKVDFRVDSILTDKYLIKPFVLDARLIADYQNPSQHQLVVDSFNFGFGKKNNIRGNVSITNPDEPQIAANFQSRVKFKTLKKLLPSKYIKLKKGYVKVDLKYQSPLHDTINAKNYLLNATIDGKAQLVNGKIYYNYRDFTFDNIYGHLRFDQHEIYIDDLALEVNDNQLYTSGQTTNFFSFFILPDQQSRIKLNVASPRFDFGQFTAPEGLKGDSITAFSNTFVTKTTKVAIDSTEGFMTKTGSIIDRLLNKGTMELSTDIEELIYKKFKATEIMGNISLQPDTLQLRNMNLNIAKGKLMMDGSITDIVQHEPKMQMKVQLNNNDIPELFRQFDNFGQTQIGHENMKGIGSATLQFNTDIDANYTILPETMHGDLAFRLSGGHLMEIEALSKKKGLLYNKRKLDYIEIDTIDTRIRLRGNDMYIDRMEVHSSAFDFELEGVYNLSEESNTRLFFTIPSGNFIDRHVSSAEIKSGSSRRKGPRMLLELRQKEDGFSFRLPVFGRKRMRRYRLEE
ncbi:MAG: hypothetical protein ACJATF_000295 [Flavobacteriales bacterium]|jgi:hypothetical protein